eukprot:m.37031 g.37031  ORF g.37031 m.37031 type:complete len:212 (+) comp6714_c0_seq1:89-724(+)
MSRQQEIAKSLSLNPVQQDLYWRGKYKHDDFIEKKAQSHVQYKSNNPIPTAPQLKHVEKSTSQSQLSGGRRSSYQYSVPTHSGRNNSGEFQKHALKQPKPLKITRKASDQTATHSKSSLFNDSYSRYHPLEQPYPHPYQHSHNSTSSLDSMNSEASKRSSSRGTSLLEASQVNPFSASQRYSCGSKPAKTSSGLSNIGTRPSSSWKSRQKK